MSEIIQNEKKAKTMTVDGCQYKIYSGGRLGLTTPKMISEMLKQSKS